MTRWVFLRGLMRETRHWGAFPEIFRTTLPQADITLLDLPGNGLLHKERSPVRVAHMTDACRRQLLDQGIAPPYHLFALSLGAMVAVDWAARYPQEVAGCVLLNTSLRPVSPFYQRLRPRNYPALLRLGLPGLRQRDFARQERVLLQLTSQRGAGQAAVLESWTGYQREHPVSYVNAWRQLYAAMRFRAPPQAPPMPLLLLAGGADRLIDPRCSQQLARLWRAPLAVQAGAGHDLTLDAGCWVAEQVRDWLAAMPSQLEESPEAGLVSLD